jgi:hypothetical protein
VSGSQVKGEDRFQQLSGPLSLALFVLLRGSDSTLLKWLQLRGASIAMDEGIEVISFCNVFFFSTLVSGMGLVLLDRRTSCERLKVLTVQEKQLLAWQTVLGFFLAPVAYYLALESLGVVQQTLVFSLTVPASALLASWSLGERHAGQSNGYGAPVNNGYQAYGTPSLTPEQQVQRCNLGRLIGGLGGGAAAYAMSRDDGRSWAIPLGALLGSQVGCNTAAGRGPLPW